MPTLITLTKMTVECAIGLIARGALQVAVLLLLLVAWRSGRTSVFDRRTFPVSRSTYS